MQDEEPILRRTDDRFVLFPIKHDTFFKNSTICSSLIAEALQHQGIVHRDVNPLSVLPHDFGEHSERPLILEEGYELGPVTFLRMVLA